MVIFSHGCGGFYITNQFLICFQELNPEIMFVVVPSHNL